MNAAAPSGVASVEPPAGLPRLVAAQGAVIGPSRVIRRGEINPEIVMGADQVLVGMNKTRRNYNARIRQLMGRTDNSPVAGCSSMPMTVTSSAAAIGLVASMSIRLPMP